MTVKVRQNSAGYWEIVENGSIEGVCTSRQEALELVRPSRFEPGPLFAFPLTGVVLLALLLVAAL